MGSRVVLEHWSDSNQGSDYIAIFIIACKRSLGQGTVFTPVCHSVHKWVCIQGGSASREGFASRGFGQIPHQILWDMVNEWALLILLECILITAHKLKFRARSYFHGMCQDSISVHRGGCLLPGGCLLLGGCLLPGKCLLWGGGICFKMPIRLWGCAYAPRGSLQWGVSDPGGSVHASR